MSIADINEQLLRAIGVGVALLEEDTLGITFSNDTFSDWFLTDDPTLQFEELFPQLDGESLRSGLQENNQYTLEFSFKKGRRPMIFAADFSYAKNQENPLIVMVCQNISRIRELETMIDSYSKMVERNTREIKREKEQVEKLLLNMMPRSVYEEYKTFGVVTPTLYDPITVLMLDFVGFTEMAVSADPSTTVSELNDIYSAFDRIGEQYGCERIKTIGDAYITVAGLPEPTPDHTLAVASTAIRFVRYLKRRNQSHSTKWRCRIGLATGSVVGSVVGIQKYVYDIFGPAVNFASRLQDCSEAMEITISKSVSEALTNEFLVEEAGVKQIRGFGEQEVFKLRDSRVDL
ncbi:adenylate/guanylate cyclase domain-containing protein [Sneathiella limimaris]|uniref:adenylate/guanylate cyclase domain-containing protein n=1 Tax=Sneathiella limimaris TaxID=1964213 RepID=UPI00146C8A0D|nr:adenylate/guanylate cyclase domain-containing protein [Sneathiella limimaris]